MRSLSLRTTAFLFGLLVAPAISHAHPVSFKDGFGIMPAFSPERSEVEVNYSITNSAAVGINYISLLREKRPDVQFVMPQFNYKLYRDNQLGSQTNLYASVGMGGAQAEGSSHKSAGLLALQADYETRRIYTLGYAEQLMSEGEQFTRLRYRAGVAPYLASFEGFHTWLIGQIEFTDGMDDRWTASPIARFFYKNYLVELGVSHRGDASVAGIFHF